ncbi:hypothetical protein K8I28_00160 [bacterium]|nr:hypothetical protein [bacterium]
MRQLSIAFLLFCLIITFGMLMGCAEDDEGNPADPIVQSSTESDCQGCHTDRVMLMATADPIEEVPPPEGGGEG